MQSTFVALLGPWAEEYHSGFENTLTSRWLASKKPVDISAPSLESRRSQKRKPGSLLDKSGAFDLSRLAFNCWKTFGGADILEQKLATFRRRIEKAVAFVSWPDLDHPGSDVDLMALLKYRSVRQRTQEAKRWLRN